MCTVNLLLWEQSIAYWALCPFYQEMNIAEA
jgi:hypothetical protein